MRSVRVAAKFVTVALALFMVVALAQTDAAAPVLPTVERIDGDVLVLDDGTRAHLDDVNLPLDQGTSSACGAAEAGQVLRSLVVGRPALVERRSGIERVIVDGEDVALAMLRAGWASPKPIVDAARSAQVMEAMQVGSDAEAGWWAMCDPSRAQPTT